MTRSPSATPQVTRLYFRAIFPCLAHPSSHEDVHLSIWLWHAESQQFKGAKMPRVLSKVWDTAVMPQSLNHVTGFRGVCHLVSAQTQGITKSLLITPCPVLAQFVQMVGANISPSLGKNNNSSGTESVCPVIRPREGVQGAPLSSLGRCVLRARSQLFKKKNLMAYSWEPCGSWHLTWYLLTQAGCARTHGFFFTKSVYCCLRSILSHLG